MYQENVILCAVSAYKKKYYLNERFEGLPQSIKDELKILCVLYIEEIGGILSLVFDDDGILYINAEHDDGDLFYDEIGSHLKIRQIQEQKKELLESLELYYKVFFLNEELPDDIYC